VSTTGRDYLRHWGLAEPPFLIEPDPRFAYERSDHREALARMLFGLTQLGGLVLITGEIGCGKTMLAETLRGMLSGGGYRIVAVPNPPRTSAALLGALLEAAGGPVAGGSAARLSGLVREQLADAAAHGQRVVLAIDEAQRLDARALDEVRMLTNPGSGGSAPTVLLGQPELSTHIGRYPQVAQRVVVRFHLQPMNAEEVEGYIGHRSRVAGSPRRLFTRRATAAVHEETGGTPRLVNLLCANALFVGAARSEDQIGADTIRDLAEDRRRSEHLADRGHNERS
jgi:general secretion pathway protein A